jgi:hypothetical protein
MTFTQRDSSVTATLKTASGSELNYIGSVNQSAVTTTGSRASCSGCDLMSLQCPNSTEMRDVRIQLFALNGTVAGNSFSGTTSATFNVFVAGTSTEVGTVTVSDSLSLTRQ